MNTLLTSQQFMLTINRLAQQLIENDDAVVDTIFIGLQPRGVFISDIIIEQIKLWQLIQIENQFRNQPAN